MSDQQQQKRVVIVGGGFAGIASALALDKLRIPNVKIQLISDKPHFEYHPALYRIVVGGSPTEACIPLREIFAESNIEVLEDRITALYKDEKRVNGESGSRYHFDILILALGSETNYFGISGLKEYSHSMKSIEGAHRLKRHVVDMIRRAKVDCADKTKAVADANFVIIGAGPTGVELAGDLITYAKDLATEEGVDPSLVTVTLIEGAPKIMPVLPKELTDPVDMQLRKLGVTIFLNRVVDHEEVEKVFMKDMQMMSGTVIWTAGVKGNSAYQTFGLGVDKRGRVEVGEHLEAKGEENIYILGDGAATKYSGLAQTALYDGNYVARVIAAKISGETPPAYEPEQPSSAIPAGQGWAAVEWQGMHYFGAVGWWLRRAADLRAFLGFLPFGRALSVWMGGLEQCSCGYCNKEKEATGPA
jgi:NADH:ubiquinone reductase (H+-translocating)